MKNWKKAFSFSLLIFLSLGNTELVFGQTEQNKTIKKDFAGKTTIKVSHQYGPLVIKKSIDGKIHLDAEMVAKANDEESLQVAFDHFDLITREDNGNLDLSTKLDIENWNTINGKTTIKFKDGKKVHGLRDVKVNLTLYVPNLQRLDLLNKYDDIRLETELAGDLNVNLYSGKLISGEVKGNFQLDMKYSKAHLQNLGKATMNIYDSDLTAGDVTDLVVNSKYSEVKIGNVSGKLVLDTYDDKWKTGNIGGQLSLIDKYSEFDFGNFKEAKIDIYDGNIVANQGGSLQLSSKYSAFKINRLTELDLVESFDDQVAVQEMGSMQAMETKYSEYHIDRLLKKLTITESFDDQLKVLDVAADFSSVSVNGKYTEVSLKFAETTRFQVTVDLTYGKFDYPENKLAVKILKEKDSKTYVSGTIGGGSDKTVMITGYDNQVVIR